VGVAPAEGESPLRKGSSKKIIEEPTNASTASTNTRIIQGLRF
jgi:hypothetical protein